MACFVIFACGNKLIDKIGTLELKLNAELSCAVKLLELGPSERTKNALVVFRHSILDLAVSKFAKTWGGY